MWQIIFNHLQYIAQRTQDESELNYQRESEKLNLMRNPLVSSSTVLQLGSLFDKIFKYRIKERLKALQQFTRYIGNPYISKVHLQNMLQILTKEIPKS